MTKTLRSSVNVCDTYTFSGTFTRETFKINHQLNCGDKCSTYLFMCKCCGKKYVGESTGEFRFRWNNYKCNEQKYTRNEKYLQKQLFRHFHSGEDTGFLENVKIMLIDKTHDQSSKKREDYW